MNLPLMSPAALDNAVFELVARELGVANAMRFIARHNQPDGIDYTTDRKRWLTQGVEELESMFAESNPDFNRLMAKSKRGDAKPRRQSVVTSRKGKR